MPTSEPQREKRRYRSLLDASDASPRSLRHRRGGSADLTRLKATLRAAGVFEPCPGYYPRKFAEVLALWGASVAALILARHSQWLLLVAPLWALATAQTILLAHDVAHGNAFSTRGRLRLALSRWAPHLLIGGLAGGSASWWKQSHNAHHVLSNDPGLDPDIDYPFLAFDLAQAQEKPAIFRPILRYQHVLIWFLFPVVAVTTRIYSVAFLLRRLLRPGEHKARYGLELGVLLAHWALYLGLVCTLLPLHLALAFVALHQAGFGAYIALVTATNHWAMPMPNAKQLTFLEHQVMTSRNIGGGPLVRFFFGGLDTQIEHHLFVGLPRPRLREAQPHVRSFCVEHRIPYVEVSFVEALKQIYRCLRAVAAQVRAGALALPAEQPASGHRTSQTEPLPPLDGAWTP